MVSISPHTTRAPGTILTATIYNFDHGNHVANAQALNVGKVEGAGSVVNETIPVFDGVSGAAIKGSGRTFPLSTADIADESVTYAKIQDVSETARILGRKTAGSGPVEECTLSEILDFIGSATEGDILYRDASAWVRLPRGSNGQVLTLAGDVPTWAPGSGMVLLTSGSVTSQATLDINLTSFSGYRALKFLLQNFIPVTDDRELWMRLSTNGGSSYDATGYSFAGGITRDGATTNIFGSNGPGTVNQLVIAGNVATATESVSNTAAEGGANVEVMLYNHTATGVWPSIRSEAVYQSASGQCFWQSQRGQRETAQNTDAVRFLFESGNIASGNYAVYGLL